MRPGFRVYDLHAAAHLGQAKRPLLGSFAHAGQVKLAAMAKQLQQDLQGQQEAALAEAWVQDLESALQEPIVVDLDNLPTGANDVIEVKDDEVQLVKVNDDDFEGVNSDDKAKEDARPTQPAEDARPARMEGPRPRWAAGVLPKITRIASSGSELAICDTLPTWML